MFCLNSQDAAFPHDLLKIIDYNDQDQSMKKTLSTNVKILFKKAAYFEI
jgi:hypothetical protein